MPSVSALFHVKKRLIWRLLIACCLAAVGASQMLAQSTFGAILGTVRDPSGGLVPGAQVTLVNIGTTASRAQVTDLNGSYGFKNIEVGAYKLTIGAPGFQTESL